ncbi:hypothetical protein [Vibrio parahaemolyticus]|uniref:hypothetical protein n=1 Tax=Vibrio parahaemolyticus TaxID=670 RepID=UPI00186A6356|nr:hypothetical protein [Vibrio parahaemolyticus]MBE3682331.1 hypothetical protein [Vibrio parahaemolyticus]MBE4171376.1 hypothetical protein [Vibrio parahaemolyticus]MBM5064226.1 hypothetical protein [Vibrio parahaemolyticus]MCR9756949.1 hypothetical protein [Vibrio parahaemolyticus]MDS1993140.1 hypothetical protein [Vibrio parahaemolyticus]
MTRRVSGLPDHWQDYFLCVLLHMVFPFFPLLMERLLTGGIHINSLMLFSAMYPLSIGLSSDSKLLFGCTILISLFFSVAYGVVAASETPLADFEEYSLISLIAIFVIHLLERYNKHVVDRTPFWSFNATPGGQ